MHDNQSFYCAVWCSTLPINESVFRVQKWKCSGREICLSTAMNPIHIAAKKLMAAKILVFITISRGRELKSACRRAGGKVIGGEVEPATSNNSDDIFMVLPATSLPWRVDMDKAMIALRWAHHPTKKRTAWKE